MEQILFLVLLAIVGLLRWISSAAEERRNREAEKRTGTPPPNTPIQRAPAETEEERIRRFMEALGVPTAPPPPQSQQQQAPPPPPRKEAPRPTRKTLPVDPFPSPRGGLPIPPVVAAPAPPPMPQPPRPLIPPRPSPTPAPPPLPTRETTVLPEVPVGRRGADFDVRDIDGGYEDVWRSAPGGRKAAAADPAATMPATLAARLRNKEALRDAIILREVFGPPRSMQPLEPEPRGLI